MSEELKPILPYARHLNLKEIFIFYKYKSH